MLESMGDEFVRVPKVRAVSDGLVLVCELPDGQRVGVPLHLIHRTSEVRKPGDAGVLVISAWLARDLGFADAKLA